MKHLFKFFTLSIFTFFLLFASTSVFGAGNPSTKVIPPKIQVAPVATVNIQKANIVSQTGSTFVISFELSNREMLQTGVKYGVKLVSQTGTKQFLVDEKVYDESLTLAENSTIKKEITYIAPSALSGTYAIVLFSSNSSGFPFGISFVKEVKLITSTKGFEIVTDSCYLKVEGEKSNKHYGLLQIVDIGSDESLRLTCNTVNRTNDALSLTPSYETRYHSAYGDIVPTTGGDTMPIAFKALKSENFSVLLPKATTPKVYNVNIKLSNGNTTSNSISAQYVLRGVTATITNLSLDKDYYQRGDTAILSLIWNSSSPMDIFLRGDNAELADSTLSLDATITNDYGVRCAQPLTQNLIRSKQSPKTEVSMSITSRCFNPHIALTIKDDKGTILDQKEFDIESTSIPEQKRASPRSILWVILAIAVLVIGSVYMKKKNGTTTTDINN